MSNKENLLPETVKEVAFDAVFNNNIKSLIRLLSWFDTDRVSKAYKRILFKRKRGGKSKTEEYAENVFINSAEVSWDEKAKRHIKLLRAKRVEKYVLYYYYPQPHSSKVMGKVKKMVCKVRNRVFIRIYRMPEEKLQELLAARKNE